MGRRGPSLLNSLDNEVYVFVQSLLDEDDPSAVNGLDVDGVCDMISASKRPLARKPRKPLKQSIERVLSVLQEEAGSDSEAELETKQAPVEVENSNAMNRAILKDLRKAATNGEKSRRAENGDRSRPDDEQADSSAVTDGKKSSRKHRISDKDSEPRKKQRPDVQTDKKAYNAPTHVSLADMGGMESVIKEFEEHLLLPLKIPSHYLQRGLRIPRGILLHGPPGCGKTMLCEAVAAELGLPFVQVSAPSIVSGMSGESEKAIREHFDIAKKLAPCVMFIDEIDTITPKRETAQREMERRMVGQLLTCMDDLALEKNDGKPVIVLAATNRPDSLDPALRRAGRFDTEINIGVPNAPVREQILRAQTRQTEVADDVDFTKLAKMTPGFVGADLESLVLKAGNVSNLKYLSALKTRAQALEAEAEPETMDIDDEPDQLQSQPHAHQPISETVSSFRALNKLLTDQNNVTDIPDDPITMADFEIALLSVQPSAKREGFATIPETTWSNIGALQSVRHQLVNAVVKPIQSPEKYEKFGIAIPAGVLLWGPPGCGKTLLAKAVANESKANFISVKGPELLNKYVGESERAVRQVFFRARSSVPCVIFFDELDALVPKRDDALSDASARVVNTLLTELDGISNRSGIYVIAATNRPDMIDSAMLRPGRLGKHLYVGPPGADERVEILTTIMARMPVADQGLAEFARRCTDFTGADLNNLAYEAAQLAVQREGDVVELEDLEVALGSVKPSVSKKELNKFTTLKETF